VQDRDKKGVLIGWGVSYSVLPPDTFRTHKSVIGGGLPGGWWGGKKASEGTGGA